MLTWVINQIKIIPKTLLDYPLRAFYFIGPIWKNIGHANMCYEMTGIDSDWWISNADVIAHCEELLERHYVSFRVTIICTLYFGLIGISSIYVLYRFFFLRPIIYELRSLFKNNKQMK